MTQFNSTRQPRTKTALTTVLEIRLRYKEGWSQARLAREYQLSVNTIHKMVTLQSYNKVAIVGTEQPAMALASAVEKSALEMLAFQRLLDQNRESVSEAVTLIQDLPQTVYCCESCGVAEGGEHLESCQDASGGTLVRQ